MFAAFLLNLLMMSKGVSPPFVEFPFQKKHIFVTKRLNAQQPKFLQKFGMQLVSNQE